MARTNSGASAHHIPPNPLRGAAQPARKRNAQVLDLIDSLTDRANRIYRAACALDMLSGSLKDLGLTEFQVNAMRGLLQPISECLTTDSLALADMAEHGVDEAVEG
jgi:hypothetical protein